MSKIIEKSLVFIKDMSKVEDALSDHMHKIAKAVRYYNATYVKITSHIEVDDKGEAHIQMTIQEAKKK